MMCDPKLTNRLKRIEGQIKALINASETERIDCQAMSTQLLAIKGATEQALLYLTSRNLKNVVEGSGDVDEAISLMAKNFR